MISTDIYAFFGNFCIDIYMLGELSYKDEWNYAEQKLVGRKSTYQLTGQSARQISSLTIHLHWHFHDVLTKYVELENMAKEQKAYPFFLTSGANFGNYLIKSFELIYKRTDNQGNMLEAEIRLTLIEYVPPQEKVAKKKAPAVKDSKKNTTAKAQKKTPSSSAPKTSGKKKTKKATTAKEIVRQNG